MGAGSVKRRASPWTEADIARVRAYLAEGLPVYRIAPLVGLTRSGLKQRLYRVGVEFRLNVRVAAFGRGAEVLRQHYTNPEMPTKEIHRLYEEAIGQPARLKMMREHANRIGLLRPFTKAQYIATAEAARVALATRKRAEVAREIQALHDGGLTLTAARKQFRVSEKRLALMRAEGLITHHKRKPAFAHRVRKPKPTPEPKPVRVVKAAPVIIPEPPRPPAPLPAPVNGKIYANFRQIRAWAEDRGFCYDGSNMDQVNRRRAAMGLPVLVQDEGVAA